MATFGDYADAFLTKYVKKTKPEIKQDLKQEIKQEIIKEFSMEAIPKEPYEDDFTLPSEYDSATKKFSIDDLTPEKRRLLALVCPYFMKGVHKKSMDTFRAWCEIRKENGDKLSKLEHSLIRKFDRRSDIKKKFTIAKICAEIYGDGLIQILYVGDNEGNDFLKTSPPETAQPWDLRLIDPEKITEIIRDKKNKKDKTFYYHYVNTNTHEDKLIHPDRILSYKTAELPFNLLGISKVDMLINILNSGEEVDIACGEILKWFSHGIVTLTKQGMKQGEKDRSLKLLSTHPNYYALNEKYTLDVKNPTAINPTPFYDRLIGSIAAVLMMPLHILKGVEIGKVTGAEIGYADYYRDVKDEQDLICTPLLNKLYSQLYRSIGREFDRDIIWNITYIDEMAEAELLGKRTAAAANARSAKLITLREARKMISDGQIYLDPDIIPDDFPNEPEPDFPEPKKPIKPSPRIVKPVVRKKTEENQELIDSYKKLMLEVAEKERKLGLEILEEQEKK